MDKKGLAFYRCEGYRFIKNYFFLVTLSLRYFVTISLLTRNKFLREWLVNEPCRVPDFWPEIFINIQNHPLLGWFDIYGDPDRSELEPYL